MSVGRSADEVQRDLARHRERIGETVEEIRKRLAPGRLLDRAVDDFREQPRSGGRSRLTRAIVENRRPVPLIGAGVTWLALAATQERPRSGGRADREPYEPHLDEDSCLDPEIGGEPEPGPLSGTPRTNTADQDGPRGPDKTA